MTRRGLMLLFPAFCAACGPETQAARPATDPLAPFYAAVRELQAGRRERVAVLQVGDSHTANDSFSGRVRELMQERFGDAGRGMLPPGIPYRYYKPAAVHVSADGWEIRRGGPLGFAGLRQHTETGGSMLLEAAPPDLARVEIELLLQPGGGTLDIATSDGRSRSVPTAAPTPSLLRVGAPAGDATTSVTLRARGDGPVDLLAWYAGRPGPGVTWSNLGTPGATVEIVGGWDPNLLRAEAAALDPALIVLAFGTNEGFKDSTDLAAYPALFRGALRTLRGAAPRAAILVAGPPDGVRASGGVPCPDGRWVVPANLPTIRRIEQDEAAAAGAAFWDWAAAMGPACTIAAWAGTDPPLAAHDHVHLLQPGARQTAESLFATLMQGYERHRHA